MEYRVFPPIGIGRIGNSQNYFIGPEVPGSKGMEQTPSGEAEISQYKDADFKVKRQAARFQLFQRNSANDPFVPAQLSASAKIQWRVNVANKKDAIIRPTNPPSSVPATGLRPKLDVARADRLIDSGVVSIEGSNAQSKPLTGTHVGAQVVLGELRTDNSGNLLVLPASGISKSTPLSPVGGSFYNNTNWYDDVCDGSVEATVIESNGNQTIATGSWFISAPPDFAPGVGAIVTLYDIIEHLAITQGWMTAPVTTSFTKDIYPILARSRSLRWSHGRLVSGVPTSNPNWNQISDDFSKLSDGSTGNQSFRQEQSQLVRNVEDLSILSNYELTDTQKAHLTRWENGNFASDWNGKPPIASAASADSLTQAALLGTAGQGFFPGIEAGLMVTDPTIYLNPFDFRIDPTKLSAGDMTALMAQPWQADFLKCRGNWWPSQRPDIAPQSNNSFQMWARIRNLNTGITHQNLIDHVMQFGMIESSNVSGVEVCVERGRDPAID
jgi:hypothetical protein